MTESTIYSMRTMRREYCLAVKMGTKRSFREWVRLELEVVPPSACSPKLASILKGGE
jgi:hypothetical protein